MKKRLPTVILAMILMLCGCSCEGTAEQKNIEINRSFSCPVYVEHAGKSFTAMFSADGGCCKAVFSLPQELKGFCVEYSGGKLKYTLGNHSFTDLPQDSQVQFVQLVCIALNDTQATIVNNKDFIRTEGKTSAGEYYINVNSKTLQPTFFEIDSADLTVRFG